MKRVSIGIFSLFLGILVLGCGKSSDSVSVTPPPNNPDGPGKVQETAKTLPQEGKFRTIFKGNGSGSNTIHNITLSSDGQFALIAASTDDPKRIQLWNLNDKKMITEIQGKGDYTRATLSPDGKTISHPESNEVTPLIDSSTGKIKAKGKGVDFASLTQRMFFSPDSSKLYIVHPNEILACNVANGQLLKSIKAPDRKTEFLCAALFDKGNKLISLNKKGELQRMEVPGFTPIGPPIQVEVSRQFIDGFAISDDGKYFAYQISPAPLHIYDLSSGQKIRSVPTKLITPGTSGLLFVPEKSAIVRAGSFANKPFVSQIVIEDLVSGTPLYQTQETRTDLGRIMSTALAITPDGSRLVAGREDGEVEIYNLKNLDLK